MERMDWSQCACKELRTEHREMVGYEEFFGFEVEVLDVQLEYRAHINA